MRWLRCSSCSTSGGLLASPASRRSASASCGRLGARSTAYSSAMARSPSSPSPRSWQSLSSRSGSTPSWPDCCWSPACWWRSSSPSPGPPAPGRASSAVYTRTALDLLYFEDLELGGRWQTRGRTISEADLTAHAGVSGDFGPLHMDAQHAGQGHFGGRVAHGSLLISIALGLGSMDVPQPNLVGLVGTNWRFLKPVKPGTTVHAVWRLGRKREVTNPRWGLAVWQIELLDQNEDRVLEGEVTVLVNRHQVAAAVAPTRSRRRPRGKAAPEPAPALPSPETNLPEPAPADTPAPARRRRRPARATPAVAVPDPVAVAAEPAQPASSSRRRRRRRGGGGGGNGSGNAPATAQEQAPDPGPAQEPPRSQWAAPETPAQPPATTPTPAPAPDNSNPVSRVLGRLRRPRTTPKTS